MKRNNRKVYGAYMRKFGLKITLLFVCAVLFAACGRQKPEDTAQNFLEELKKGEFIASQKYVDSHIFDDVDKVEYEFLTIYFKSYEFDTPKAVSIGKDNAKVSVNLTAIDLTAVVNNFAVKAIEKIQKDNQSFEELGEEELNRMLINEMTAQNAPKKSREVTFDLVKEKGKWLLASSGELKDSIMLQSVDYELDGEEFGSPSTPVDNVTETAKLVSVGKDTDAEAVFENDKKERLTFYIEEGDYIKLKGNEGKSFTITYEIYADFGGEKTYWLLEVR